MPPRPWLLLAALAALVSSASAQHRPASCRLYRIATATKADFGRLPEVPASRLLVADRQGLSRKGDWFYLKLAGGRQVKLHSKPSPKYEEDRAEIAYRGKLPYLKKYVLRVTYWERSATLLIDQQTGRIDTLQDEPIPSVTYRKLVVPFAWIDGTEGVDVYAVRQGQLHKLFTLTQDKWSLIGLRWVDNDVLILKCLPRAEVEKANGTAELNHLLKTTRKFFTCD